MFSGSSELLAQNGFSDACTSQLTKKKKSVEEAISVGIPFDMILSMHNLNSTQNYFQISGVIVDKFWG